jgi:hypothetical protein
MRYYMVELDDKDFMGRSWGRTVRFERNGSPKLYKSGLKYA